MQSTHAWARLAPSTPHSTFQLSYKMLECSTPHLVLNLCHIQYMHEFRKEFLHCSFYSHPQNTKRPSLLNMVKSSHFKTLSKLSLTSLNRFSITPTLKNGMCSLSPYSTICIFSPSHLMLSTVLMHPPYIIIHHSLLSHD